MTDAELNLVQLKELKRQLGSENRFIGEKICQNAIDCISNLVEARVSPKNAEVKPYCENCIHSFDTEENNNVLVCQINETIDINVNADFGCTLFKPR